MSYVQWFLEHAGEWGDVIVLLTAIGGGGLWVIRMLMTGRKQVQALFENQRDLMKAVAGITEQLKPNGGSSVFDMLKKTSTQVGELSAALERVKGWQWAFAETIDTPIWESDEHGQCLRINTAMSRLIERSPAEMAGAGWENAILPADRARVWDEWEDAIDRKRQFESEYTVIAKGGAKFRVRAVATPVSSERGTVVAYFGRYEDVRPAGG